MILKEPVKYDFNDLAIKPTIISDISHRKEINLLDENGMLPLITAPMFDVVDKNNIDIFNENNVYGIYPRLKFDDYSDEYLQTSSITKFIAVGLDDFKYYFLDKKIDNTKKYYILIDIANGHMRKLYDYIYDAKQYYKDNLIIMAGNIANPLTYVALSNAGASYVRVSIGSGNSCLTAQNGAVSYPIASLIEDTYNKSCEIDNPAKIIADGGMKSYSDIIKALALGADMVMIGGLFNKCIESSGKDHVGPLSAPSPITREEAFDYFENGITICKEMRGMSTKEVQKQLGNVKLKTSEGTVRYNLVEYTLKGFIENLTDYMKTTLSYTGKYDMKDFIGNVDLHIISENSYRRFNK